jgi:dihydroxyacid dehydratase/phosphogluconate dehydratase
LKISATSNRSNGMPHSCAMFCATAGEMVMELVAKNIRPRDIVTRKALENAATASGRRRRACA